jgi:hypothetical protein
MVAEYEPSVDEYKELHEYWLTTYPPKPFVARTVPATSQVAPLL